MGSVIDWKLCPRCKSEAQIESYYSTDEEFTFCPMCGYTKSVYIKRDENGTAIYRKNKEALPENMIWVNEEIGNPYGVLHVWSKNSASASLLQSEADYNLVLADMKANPQNLRLVKSAYVTRLHKGKIVSINLLIKFKPVKGFFSLIREKTRPARMNIALIFIQAKAWVKQQFRTWE